MSKQVLLFLICIGIVVGVGGIIVAVVIAILRRRRQKQREALVQEYLKQNPETRQLDVQPVQPPAGGGDCINECLTCSMIKMGSSVSYSDDSCPQCGANTTKTFIG
eukprot:TRINITY_DN25455_c0_g1_i2.p1 TRINITY_DN25455_c0_g1~~TRINITY_DN25455_c0_g1_i2.p1  ORF type:complete len:106 (+),score=24.26 TRINITY_DN25455_c0_g1_i2:53-370(+)